MFEIAFPIKPCQLCDLAAVQLGSGKPELLFECLLQDLNVLVFAKYQRHYDPVIPSADLPVGSLIPTKYHFLPTRDIRGRPEERCRLFMKAGGLVADVVDCE